MAGSKVRVVVVALLVALVTVVPVAVQAATPGAGETSLCAGAVLCTPGTALPLPHGERLSVEMTALPTELGVLCDDGSTGWYKAELLVRRVSSTGAELGRAAARGCAAPGADPFAEGVGALVPNLVWSVVSVR